MKVAFDPIAALDLPDAALVDLRIPKTLLIENGTPTAVDKRRIRECVEEVRWLAALKPTKVGIAGHRDEVREYLEIAVLKLTIRTTARAERLTELVHRAVPYPVLLVVWRGDASELSLAHKRWSQGEAGKTVLDGDVVTVRLGDVSSNELATAFEDAISISRQPRNTLYVLYQGWINTFRALLAAEVTGRFLIPTSATESSDLALALEEYWRLECKIAELTTAARKETQIARQADMNLELKGLRTNRDVARARL